MDNFNLRKYLAEGKLKENFEFTENDIDEMNETAFMAGWNLGQKGVGKGSLYSSAESAFRIWNSDSMEDLAKNKLNENTEGSIRNARYKGDTVILDTTIDGEEVKDLIFKDTGEVLSEPESYDEEWVYAYETEHNGKEYNIGVGFFGNPSTDLEFSDIMDDTIQVSENKLEEGKINIKPQLDVNHHIVFKNPDAASRKLYNAGVDFENVGFLFPKMSYETWETIKELFSNDEIGDMGQI